MGPVGEACGGSLVLLTKRLVFREGYHSNSQLCQPVSLDTTIIGPGRFDLLSSIAAWAALRKVAVSMFWRGQLIEMFLRVTYVPKPRYGLFGLALTTVDLIIETTGKNGFVGFWGDMKLERGIRSARSLC